MNCGSCGVTLPQEAKACPNCGTFTPAYYSNSGSLPNEPTVSRPLPYNLPEKYPGANPYAPPPPPQASTAPSAPLPQARTKKPGILRGLGVSLALLLIFSAAGFSIRYLLSNGPPSAPGQSTPAPTPQPRLTAAQAQTLYNQTTSKHPDINDTLTHPDNLGWDDTGTQYTKCSFTSGSYHAQAQPGYFAPCYALATNYTNFVFQARITFVSGHSGGLVFRADSKTDQAYQFRISTDGTYILHKFITDSSGQSQSPTLFSGSSSAVDTNPAHPNLVAVLVQGSYIYAFVNKQYVNSTRDTTYQSGQVGVYVDSDAGAVEAIFGNAQLWSL